MKLAILLLCHKNPEQINLFLETLHHPDIEFFIHVDKKTNMHLGGRIVLTCTCCQTIFASM